MSARVVFPSLMFSALLASTAGAQVVRSGAGTSADVLVSLTAFRTDLGTLNPNNPGSLGTGRREINWDGVPAASASPNAFPGDFFNGPAAGRARGVIFTTPGSQLEVSANNAAPPIAFGNIDASYAANFAAFSPQRLFTAVGSNFTDVHFYEPGSLTPGRTRGFGVVFSDVDLAGSTSIEFYDARGTSLGVYAAPSAGIGSQTFSFIGVSFVDPIVARVRITSGTVGPAAGVLDSPELAEAPTDVVVMDDFIYGEPVAAPPCLADFNSDGWVDPDDLADFITCFFLDVQFPGFCAEADFNGDTFRDPDDLADFITTFFLGCEG
jgi:hypothetical protein